VQVGENKRGATPHLLRPWSELPLPGGEGWGEGASQQKGERPMRSFTSSLLFAFILSILGLTTISCGGGDDDSSSNEGESEAEGEDNVCVVGTPSTCESQSQCAQFDHCDQLLVKADDGGDDSDNVTEDSYQSYKSCIAAEEHSPCTLRCGDGQTHPGQWTPNEGCYCRFLDDDFTFGRIEETCNGLDDDCDGEVDNGFDVGQPCDGDDDDRCEEGEWVCSADGTDQVCTDETDTIPELCNGLDDDCDEQVDDGFYDSGYLGQPCGKEGSNMCYMCNSDGTGTICTDYPGPYEEICGDGMDNNCNGVIDGGGDDGC